MFTECEGEYQTIDGKEDGLREARIDVSQGIRKVELLYVYLMQSRVTHGQYLKTE